ncbi:fructose-6-phosphate aldolase [Polycladomyces sp. WAk]|uniref:Fructose-6-phosphate aldolase n=1 Tax=Polycladomyces zharkentensis TaxID=2807616 RepID=A0ABS2WHJ2_9BACL|nr:fructose-6-phosphate aldolase [Polycladomyces sp. WAk]
MELYIDSANIEQIAQVMPLGILQGVTTNPTLIAKEKRDFQTLIRNIAKLVDGKIWCQVTSTEAESMVNEALEINSWAKNIVIKLPMGMEGLKAASILSRKGVETNMTLVYSVPQAVLAAKAGVSYVSPYVGRVDDTGWDGMSLIKEIVDVFQSLQVKTKVIAASIRGPQQVIDALRTGVHAVTMPYQVLLSMVRNPMTDIGLEQFMTDWNNANM